MCLLLQSTWQHLFMCHDISLIHKLNMLIFQNTICWYFKYVSYVTDFKKVMSEMFPSLWLLVLHSSNQQMNKKSIHNCNWTVQHNRDVLQYSLSSSTSSTKADKAAAAISSTFSLLHTKAMAQYNSKNMINTIFMFSLPEYQRREVLRIWLSLWQQQLWTICWLIMT